MNITGIFEVETVTDVVCEYSATSPGMDTGARQFSTLKAR
jgi:hypothetical protein